MRVNPTDGTEDDVPIQLQEIEIVVLNTSSCRDLMPPLNQQSVQDEHVCVWDPRDVSDDEKRGICQVNEGNTCTHETFLHMYLGLYTIIRFPYLPLER